MANRPDAVLLHAAAAFGSGRICLVIGAGASAQYPTNLPLSRALALEAHAGLVDDEILVDGECDPEDLSSVADAVWDKLTSQRELVRRFHPQRLHDARPNEGYRIAVALMLEGVIRSLVTLNFDLAATNALSEVGSGGRIGVITGPEDWPDAGVHSIIFLHRNIRSDPETLVLKSRDLDVAWRDNWVRLVAAAALTVPVCVFAGLGTPATVLVETAELIHGSLGAAEFYLANPGKREDSGFAAALGIDERHYVQLAWNQFMKALGDRALREYRRRLLRISGGVAAANGWPPTALDELADRMAESGIVRIGRMRGMWVNQSSDYLPLENDGVTEQMSEIIVGLALLEAELAAQCRIDDLGVVEFRRGAEILGRMAVASGRGVLDTQAVATAQRRRLLEEPSVDPLPAIVVVAGSQTAPPSAAPESIVSALEEGDVLDAAVAPHVLTFAALRADGRLLGAAWEAL